MLLTKVDQLAHVGRFQKLEHRAEPFKRMALLFARNGYGKTTVCAVLRSAKSQDSRPVDERAHLGAGGSPSATLQFDPCGTIAFNNGSWNKSAPAMLIFDGEYVRTNVHAAEEVTRENKRKLLQVIIGSSGVTLAGKISALEQENESVNGTLRKLEAAIRRAVPAVDDVAAFVKTAKPADLFDRTAAAARLVAVSERAAEISRRPLLLELPDEALSPIYPDLLSEIVEELSPSGRDVVGQHIAKHGMGPEGRRWLRYGVEHSTAEDCPFCDQLLSGSPVFEPMRLLFSPAYQRLSDAIENTRKVISDLAGDGSDSFANLVLQNDAQAEFWSILVKLQEVPSLPDAELALAKRALNLMAEALRVKAANPNIMVTLEGDDAQLWRAGARSLQRYSDAVVKANELIAPVKSSEGRPTPTQTSDAKQTLAKYQALTGRDAEPLKTLCDDWAQMTDRRSAIAKERAEAQQALRIHTETMASEYQESVNDLLAQFGVNFRLCQTKASFKGGGQPNTEYCIDINGHVLPVGESKGGSAPSFKTVLSAGDKASLALALFIAQAKRRADLSDLILVFDDPFSSQDSGRQFETSARLRELAALARQVVVLSHDARFLHLIRKDANPKECSEHHVVMMGDWKGAVSPWDASKEIEAEYVRRAERIRGFAATGQHLSGCNPQALAGDVRVFMEEYLDQRFPGRFPGPMALGGMVEVIEAAGADDPLHSQRRALRELNEFSRPEHHRGAEPVDPTQLRAQCKKVVKIIGSY